MAPALEADPRRQRLQQLHQRERPLRAQRDGHGHALVLEQAVGSRRRGGSDRPGGAPARRPATRATTSGHGDDHELGAAGEDGQEERPADQGQEARR